METVERAITPQEAKDKFDKYSINFPMIKSFSFNDIWAYVLHKQMEKQLAMQAHNDIVIDKEKYRAGIMRFQEKVMQSPGGLVGEELDEVNPLKHSFADGSYIREVNTPKGELIVTKIHKVAHPFFLLRGDVFVLSEEGIKRIKAPYYGITPAGTKRIIYCIEDVVWVTVHVTNETDLSKIEDEVIAKDFKEIDQKLIDVLHKEV